jgi:BirA family biotin operon repressor/biotin-[acetyl-CoA-carboxylase] ligase
MELRKRNGSPVSGGALAKTLGISRVAVWKGIQALGAAGYTLETSDAGYSLDPKKEKDFLYPWEFGEEEGLFRHFANTGSTMDRAREFAEQGAAGGLVVTAEKQSAGRGRNGKTWASRQGGLFFTILERPALAVADYSLPSLMLQIAVARTLSKVCGKLAKLRWPNDVYIDHRKIAGVITEISGEGDLVNWLAGGAGINVNNPAPSGRTTSCAEITGHPVSRRAVLRKVLEEIDAAKRRFSPGAVYAQGSRDLAAEWNSLADNIGAKTAVIAEGAKRRVLARGLFAGIDPAGRCIIKTGSGKGNLYFNPGPVSLVFA